MWRWGAVVVGAVVAGAGVAVVQGGAGAAGQLACRVETGLTVTADRADLALHIANTGGVTIDGWTLRFSLPAGQSLSGARNARIRSLPPSVVASSVPASAVVQPGAAVDVSFSGTFTVTAAAPSAVTLNGAACAVVNKPTVSTPLRPALDS
jgi:acetylxylan esterase